MRKLICVICSRPTVAESLCEEHYTAKHELFEAKSILVLMCDGCGAIFDQKWQRAIVEDALRNIIARGIKVYGKLKDINIGLKKIGNNYVATIVADGTIPPATVTKIETKIIDVRIRCIKCPSCVKLLGRYHEAVVQIRGDRTEQLIGLAENIVDKMPKRIERIKEGWNIYFVHKSDARAVISALEIVLRRAREAKLNIIRSHKVVGQKQGKNLMRDFYALR